MSAKMKSQLMLCAHGVDVNLPCLQCDKKAPLAMSASKPSMPTPRCAVCFAPLPCPAHTVEEMREAMANGVNPPNPKASPLPTGYAERKALPLYDFMFKYFPLAWLEVVKVAVAGNAQHNPGEPLHWAREKSTDQLNTAFRHMFDHGMGEQVDTDGCYHLAKSIWRLSAELQLIVEKKLRNPGGNVS